MLIALSTAARSGAILGLKCDKVNFADSIIDFRDESIEGKHKPRSVIKMPEALRPYLEDAVSKSVSGYVVEKMASQSSLYTMTVYEPHRGLD